MLAPLTLSSQVIKSVLSFGSKGTVLEINGYTFESADEVRSYFSYYLQHVLEGTAMTGGCYNANEHADGSILAKFLYENTYPQLNQYGRGVISKCKKLIKKVEDVFYHQEPLWSGKIGGDGLKEAIGLRTRGDLMGVVKLIVRFNIEEGGMYYPFRQLYYIGIQKCNLKPGVIIVGSRKELYMAYKSAYSQEYPIGIPYPQIPTYRLETIQGLRKHYELPPLISEEE